MCRQKQKMDLKKFKPLMVELSKNTKTTIPILEEKYKGNYDANFIFYANFDNEENKKYKYIGFGKYEYEGHYFFVYRPNDIISSYEKEMDWWSGYSTVISKTFMWEYDPKSELSTLLDEYIELYNKRARVLWDQKYDIAVDHGCYNYYNQATKEYPQYHNGVKPAPDYIVGWYHNLHPDYNYYINIYIQNEEFLPEDLKPKYKKKNSLWDYITGWF